MKRVAAAVLVVCLMSGTSALAQSSSQHHDRAAGPPKGAGPTHGGPPGGPTVHTLPVNPIHPTGAFNTGRTVTPAFQGGPSRAFNTGRPSFGAPGFRPGGNRPQYNAQYFPRTFNIGQRYQWRGGPWRGPQGFYYRPWFYGQVLPFGWFSAPYYINDYYDYSLPVPPYGYEWIRNGPDALLVDIGSGEVVSSVPGVFY
jgi:hypothetical protein